ncbi:hypothetical protein DFH11DRAFT_1723197 [Phellopilus nigrolimitatus]|nr:hypothetical protein DFH11DRAFT_1723197 [Phellopilus nigrolimitatus]
MDEEEASDIDANYVKHFQNHLAHFSEHLNGVDAGHGPSQPSYFSPTGFWTSEDKDLFFHALSVHSRLRPDLIAAEIPGKTVVDVCVYIDLLAEASSKDARKLSRSAFEPAIEVSDGWVAFEEKQAEAMAAHEVAWVAKYREERRADALEDERLALRDQNREQKTGRRDREEEKYRRQMLKEFQEKQEAQWRKEDYMEELCAAHLRVIDGIFRDSEESIKSSTPRASPSDVAPVALEVGYAGVNSMIDPVLLAMSSPQAVQSIPAPPQAPVMPSQPLSNTLQSSSAPSQDIAPEQAPRSPFDQHISEVIPRSVSPDGIDDLSNLSPRSRRRLQKRLYMRRKRAERSGAEASASASRLKPGRKTNKKIERALARKKALEDEAEQRGCSLDGDVDVDLNLGQAAFTIQEEDEKEEYIDLHAGKEEYEISFSAGPTAGTFNCSVDAGEREDLPAVSHPHIGGLTLPYKIKEELSSLGSDAAIFETEGLGLFHLTALGKLMSLHASLLDVPDGVGTYISASTIKLLHEHVVCFITELMHRTIAIHDQERASKEHTKVWRLRENQIKVGTVHQALEMLDSSKDKKDHFETLPSRLVSLCETVSQSLKRGSKEKVNATETACGEELDQQDSVDGDMLSGAQSSDDNEADEDEEEIDDTSAAWLSYACNPQPKLPVHREVNAPFVWHPSLDYSEPNPYRPSSLVATEDTDVPISDMTDDSALLNELLEEEDLNMTDLEAAKHTEAGLWANVRNSRDVAEGVENGDFVRTETSVEPQTRFQHSKTADHESRYGEPRLKGRVKSSIFVEDSD